MAAKENFADDFFNGISDPNSNTEYTVVIVGGTGAGQARDITDYVGATDTATITPNWTTPPDRTSLYKIGRNALGAGNRIRINTFDQSTKIISLTPGKDLDAANEIVINGVRMVTTDTNGNADDGIP